MKRAIALLLALTALGAAGLAYAHRAVSGSAGAVELYETVLYGDRAAAEGVELRLETHCSRKLHWDSALSLGEPSALTTDFWFTPYGEKPGMYGSTASYGTWYCSASVSARVGAHGKISGELREDEPLRDIVLDVASRTEPSQQRTETVYLRDWFESFPLTAGAFLPPGGNEEGLERVLEESLAIPVPEDWQLEVTVVKDSRGAIAEYDTCPVQGYAPSLDCLGAVSGGGTLWLAVQADFIEGDGLECPGAGWLYYWKGLGELIPVFELAEAERIEQMSVDMQGRLLMLVNRAGVLYLRVYGITGGTQLKRIQETELMPLGEDDGIRLPYFGDNFIMALSLEGRFFLAELTEDGEYRLRLTDAMLDPGQEYFYSDSETVRLWDGERLVMASSLYDPSNWGMDRGFEGVIVWVYDEAGLAFCARYDCSQCIPEPVMWSYPVASSLGPELRAH